MSFLDEEDLGVSGVDPNESVDPLLQVTLPMVMFLAFVVVTEVHSLLQTSNRYAQELSSPEGMLIQARDEAILEIQRQLLLEAARAIADRRETELDLESYRRSIPTIAPILRGDLSEEFLSGSARIDTLLGAEHRPETLDDMDRSMRSRFHESAREVIRRRGEAYAAKLTVVSDANLAEARAQLEGRLASMVETARSIQLALVLNWQQAPEVDQFVKDRPKAIWERLQRGLGGGAETEADHFVNLEVEALQQRLDQLDVPLLDEVWRDAS